MNDYANFYRQIAEMERQATRGQRRNRASIGPGPAWERTPEANGGRGQPLPQQAPEWSSALRSARVSQGMAPEATDQPLDPVALARLRGETLEQRYSPLSEDWGWLDLPAGLAVATGDTFVDSLASPFSEGARQRNEDRRQMLRDAGEGVVDALDSWTLDNPGSRDWDARSNFWEDREGATNLNELFSGSPGQQRRADVQQTLADMDARSEGFWVEPDLTITAESRPDTLTRLGAVGSDLWRGPSEAARTGRREYPVYLALEQQAREAGDVAAADEYGRMANAAALSDAVNTGSGALEAAPGIGLADTLLGLGRFTGRQVLRAAGREIPYYMNPVDWSSTAAYAGRADEAMLDPGMLTRQAEPIRNAVLAAPVGAVAADLLMDGDAGDANQLAGGALITGGAIAGLPMALRGGEEFVRGRLGRTDPLADIAPRVADDAPFAFEGAPQAGRVIDAEATPAPARNFEAAVRDPETGQVYRGQDHLEAIDSAPDEAVRARLQAAYDAADEDPNVIGFVVDGQFMGREDGLAALRERAGRGRQVRIGEQYNPADGSITPRSEIDWENGSNRLPADDEWFANLSGTQPPARMNIVPEGGVPGLSADDMLREGPDGGAAGGGNAADRFRTNDTPVPVNEGWDTAGSLQQGVDDLAAQRGGWDTMGGRDMGEALIRRHGLDGALEQINRIMADPASRRARQRNGDQGAWEAVQRYIQASVNRRGIGLAPDAPNAGPRRADDASALAAIGLTGGGAALAFSGEAEAEETIDGMVIDREAELPSYTTAVGAPQAYGEYAVQEFSDGTRYVFRIDRSGPQVSLEPLGALRGMDAPSSRVGDVYQHQYDNSLPSEPYTPPPREEEPRRLGALRPALAAGAGVAASLLVPGRYGNATRMGVSGVATGVVDTALGGDWTESLPLAAGVAGGGEFLRYGADDVVRRLGTHGEDAALALDPTFRAEREAFARTLPNELPTVRVTETQNYHGEIQRPDEGLFGGQPFVIPGDEMADQGYSYNRPVERMPTQREQFLDAPPAVQRVWMDRAQQPQIGAASEGADPQRVARGLEIRRRLGEPRAPAREQADPFIAPDTGASVFGEPRRTRAPRAPLPPLADRAEAAGAQGAMRGVRAAPMREIADDLGIASEGRPVGELRKAIVRELGRRFDSTREMIAFLARYGVTAAAIGIGVEAYTDDAQPKQRRLN